MSYDPRVRVHMSPEERANFDNNTSLMGDLGQTAKMASTFAAAGAVVGGPPGAVIGGLIGAAGGAFCFLRTRGPQNG